MEISASMTPAGNITKSWSVSHSFANGVNSIPSSKSSIQEYCEGQLDAIRRINGISSLHTPVSFVCIAAFIGYLSRLAYGSNRCSDKDPQMYKDYIRNVLGQVKADYISLADDLYNVFRCGIVHSMSFTPPKGGVSPTFNIAISHSVESKWIQGRGFYRELKNGVQYTVINADDLILDLFKSIEVMFKDPKLGPNAIKFGSIQPPIKSI